MLCKHCGAELADGTAKCQFCGAVLSEGTAKQEEKQDNLDATKKIDLGKIETEETVEKEDSVPEEAEKIYDKNEERRQIQINKMLKEKQQQLSEIQKRREEKKAKQKRNRIVLIALIIVVLLGAIGGGAYYIKQGLDRTSETVIETPLPTNEPAPAETPSPDPNASPTPTAPPLATVEVTSDPAKSASQSNNSSSASTSSGHSWNATGNSGSGSGTSGASASSGGSSSKTSSGSTSSGTASSGSSSSKASSSSSAGNTSGSSSSGGASISGSTSGSGTSGISSSKINAKLAKGGEVITNASTGKLLMTFTVGNTTYYANVAPGSTTAQIKNNDYTITAAPTSETYNGNTIYEISSITSYSGSGYILPHSGTKLVTENDVKSLTKSQLSYARNEIFARHGRVFQMAEYKNYFEKQPWYHVNPNYNYSDENSNLNEIEQKNVEFLLKKENSK